LEAPDDLSNGIFVGNQNGLMVWCMLGLRSTRKCFPERLTLIMLDIDHV
jgi:hypothetical protein